MQKFRFCMIWTVNTNPRSLTFFRHNVGAYVVTVLKVEVNMYVTL